MQSLVRSFYSQAALIGSSRRLLPLLTAKALPQRRFATEVAQVKKEETQVEVEQRNKRLGVDTIFSEQKHAYVLTFPWNFQEIISDFEQKGLAEGSFWHRFILSNAQYEINKTFRQFHQACALPDYELLDYVCEGKLADYVKESVRRIQFHGLDIEMANLTVEQPKIKVLKVEVSHGISLKRSENKPASEYTITKTSINGAPQTVYQPKNDTRHFLDHLDYNYKPYVVAATLMIESPMKLYVQNQNYSAVLFGSRDEELVKNVVRVEAQVRWLDLFKILNVGNKPQFGWKITDFNNILNENPYLPQY
jgi:hypothetical protein